MHISKVAIEVDNILKGPRRRYILSSCGGQFVHNSSLCKGKSVVFIDQQPFRKVSSHKNLDQSGNESAFVRQLNHKNCKNGSNSLGQRNDMQLRTSTKAIEYINTTRI